MIRLLEKDAITSKDIELNNMPLRMQTYNLQMGLFLGPSSFTTSSFYSNATYNPYWVSVYIILPTAIYCKYWATKPNIDPLNLCRLILSLDVAINKCQREVSTLTLFHKSVAIQTWTKMQCENNFYGSSVLDGEARSSGWDCCGDVIISGAEGFSSTGEPDSSLVFLPNHYQASLRNRSTPSS